MKRLSTLAGIGLALALVVPVRAATHINPKTVALRLSDLPRAGQYVERDQTIRAPSPIYGTLFVGSTSSPGGYKVNETITSITDAKKMQVGLGQYATAQGTPWAPAHIGDKEYGYRISTPDTTYYLLAFRRGVVLVTLRVEGLPHVLQPGIVAGYARLIDKRILAAGG